MGKKYCRVPFCGQRYCSRKESPNVRFHEFPSNLLLREKWIKAIRRKDFVPKDDDTVCSQHFQHGDFNWNLKVLKLLPNAVPSIFPNFPKYLQPKIKEARRVIKRVSPEEIASYKRTCTRKNISTLTEEIPDEMGDDSYEVEYEVIQIQNSVNNAYGTSHSVPSTKDASTQADGMWDKIQELYKANRQLKSDLLKRKEEVQELTSENKTLRKEIKFLKSTKVLKKKQENDLSIQKKTKAKPAVKKPDLRGYLNPRIPRCLYAPKSNNLVNNAQKMVLSVNHLNQVVVSHSQHYSEKKTEIVLQIETTNHIQKPDACSQNQTPSLIPLVDQNVQCLETVSDKGICPEGQLHVPLSYSVDGDYAVENNETAVSDSSAKEENFILVPENYIIENHNGEVIIANERSIL